MSSTTYDGIVYNGQIRLLTDVHLPDQTRVYVTVADSVQRPVMRIVTPQLVHSEQAVDFQKQMVEDEPDASL